MESKRLITLMMISFVVIFGWQLLISKLYPRKDPGQKAPAGTAQTTATTTPAPNVPLATTQATAATVPASATPATPATQPAVAQMQQPAVRVLSPATQPSVATIGVKADYPMVVKVSSVGAGLDSVTLKDFRAPGGKGDYVFQEPYDAETTNVLRALATRSIVVNGTEVPLWNVPWTRESETDDAVTFVVDLGVVKVRRTYQVVGSPLKGGKRDRYELSARYAIENTGAAPAKVKLSFNGPTTPPHENEQGRDVQILGGYDNGYGHAVVAHHFIEEYDPKKPTRDLTQSEDKQPLLWVGTASVYFNAIVRPQPLDSKSGSPKYIASVAATALHPEATIHGRNVAITFDTDEQQIDPARTLELPASVYLGPRWRAVLNSPAYANFPLDFDQTLVLTSGPCAICTFQFLITGLVALLNAFHWLFGGFAGHGDWGLAIIAMVILVRALLHPITKRSQVAMMRMGKMGPEIERLKKKYGEDKDELNRQMMAMYKEQGIGAYLGCLPMFLQMPIWIALWSALNSTFELRQADFLWGALWFHDLSRPDMLIPFGQTFHVPLLGWPISALNLLPILLAVVFYLQQEFTPKPPATTPEQETQQKMMKWMSLLFPIFLYSQPSGLNLYILTSTSIGIIESKRIRDHIKQKEEEEKAGKILVDAPKGMKKKRDDEDDHGPTAKKIKGPQPPKTGLAGWLEQLKQKAENIQREADRQRGK